MKKILSLFLSASLFSSSLFAEAELPDFRVTHFEGDVAILPLGSEDASPISTDLSLSEGDQIITNQGGSVELSSEHGTVIELSEYSNFEVSSLSMRVASFKLKLGRMLARFASALQDERPSYRIHTPVAVASVRGTELILDVNENDELQAGVVEGEVVFGPPEGADANAAQLWTESEVITGASEGIVVKPNAAPVAMLEMPAVVKTHAGRFTHIRARAPKIRARWKKLSGPRRAALRRTALREKIRWNVPEKIKNRLTAPGKRMKMRPSDTPKHKLKKRLRKKGKKNKKKKKKTLGKHGRQRRR